MATYVLLDMLPVWLDLHAPPPPADAVLLVQRPERVYLVTAPDATRGWVYEDVNELLHVVHREQWLKRRGPVYLQPDGITGFFKADLHPPEPPVLSQKKCSAKRPPKRPC